MLLSLYSINMCKFPLQYLLIIFSEKVWIYVMKLIVIEIKDFQCIESFPK